MLEEISGWCTKGFDTMDLQGAKTRWAELVREGEPVLRHLSQKKAGREPVGAHAVRGAILERRKTAVPFSRYT
jgi:hypothetical protein